MSGRFETLIYTDCRPGQGLRGDRGLQFQAKSAGISAADTEIVQQALLYEPPTGWINERRPPEDYPPSLAHVWDPSRRVLATAQGAYLGQEVNGLREGNQITHAIVTTDFGSYGFIRPAQLLHAPFWSVEPAPSTDCPPLTAGWQPGPSEPEVLRDFVTAQEDGRVLLTTLLTALGRLGDRHASRVLFIADRPEQVIQWIAAATLLLPLRQALTVGFKVFTIDPSYCPQPVLAVHPDWAGPYRSFDLSSGFVVLDLVTRKHTEIDSDDLAQRWVGLFLDSDPYDVIDAVELASTLAAAGAPADQAHAVAVAATFGTAARGGDASSAATWVAAGVPDLVADYGEAVVAALLESATTGDLALLDQAAADGRVAGIAPAIRTALLRREIAAAIRAAVTPGDRLPAVARAGRPDLDRALRADMIAQALRGAPDELVDTVLRLAWRHRLSVPVAALGDRLARFAAWWADRPDVPCDPGCWPGGRDIVNLLRVELASRLAPPSTRHADAMTAVRQSLWRPLLEVSGDPFQVLDSIVLAAAMTSADEASCAAIAARVLGRAVDAADVFAAVSRACEVLWSGRKPTPAEALAALAVIPDRIPADPRLANVLVTELEGGWQYQGLAGGLDAAEALQAHGVPVPAGWRAAHDDDRRLLAYCQGLPAWTGRERELARKLGKLHPDVIEARAGRLAAALSRLDDAEFVATLLAELPAPVGSAFLACLARDYSRQPATTARWELMLLAAKPLPRLLRERIEGDLRKQLARAGPNLADAVSSLLACDGKTVRAGWAALVGDELRGR